MARIISGVVPYNPRMLHPRWRQTLSAILACLATVGVAADQTRSSPATEKPPTATAGFDLARLNRIDSVVD